MLFIICRRFPFKPVFERMKPNATKMPAKPACYAHFTVSSNIQARNKTIIQKYAHRQQQLNRYKQNIEANSTPSMGCPQTHPLAHIHLLTIVRNCVAIKRKEMMRKKRQECMAKLMSTMLHHGFKALNISIRQQCEARVRNSDNLS